MVAVSAAHRKSNASAWVIGCRTAQDFVRAVGCAEQASSDFGGSLLRITCGAIALPPPAYLWGDVGNRAWVRPTREPLACVRRAQRAPDWPPAHRFGDGYQRIGVGWLGFVGPYAGGMRS